MKKLLVVLSVVAFVFAVTAAVAVAQTPAPADKVNCCVKGECKAGVAKADCAKQGGKDVKDCKECKK